jgi:hypothetical protein
LVLRILDFGANKDSAGAGIDRRADGGDLGVKNAAGKGADADLDLLADAERRLSSSATLASIHIVSMSATV